MRLLNYRFPVNPSADAASLWIHRTSWPWPCGFFHYASLRYTLFGLKYYLQPDQRQLSEIAQAGKSGKNKANLSKSSTSKQKVSVTDLTVRRSTINPTSLLLMQSFRIIATSTILLPFFAATLRLTFSKISPSATCQAFCKIPGHFTLPYAV